MIYGVYMDKKIFGIRIGTIITLLVCVIVAVVIWLYAGVSKIDSESLYLPFGSFYSTL